MKTHDRAKIWATLILGLFLHLPAFASGGTPAEGLFMDPEKMYGFARSLYEEGDYYRSISELLRFTFLYPDHPKAKEAQLMIGMAYQKGKRWEKALRRFRRMAMAYPQEDVGEEAFFQIGMTLFLEGLYQEASGVFAAFLRRYPLSTKAAKARYRMALALIHTGNISSALDVLSSVGKSSELYPVSRALADEILRIEKETARKSPLLAATLSALIPGSGHLYAQKTKEGLASFLLNAALLAGTVAAVREGYLFLGGILGFFELGFYSGGIYTAAQEARNYNEREKQARILRFLKRRNISIHPFGRPGGTGLALRVTF